MAIFWTGVFILSLFILIKGADFLINSSEKIGLALGLSPFIIGVTIVAAGTSFPELVSSLFATLQGLTDVPTANAIGSNIANILLVVGGATLVGRRIVVSKDLIDIDIPLLTVSTALLIGVIYDGQVGLAESIILLLGYGCYILYTILYKDQEGAKLLSPEFVKETKKRRPKITPKDLLVLLFGILGLVLGAKYLIDSLIALSTIFHIATGVIAITAVALGTSLPELIVSIRAALAKKPEVALGNIFGSNIFNALVVVGVPGLFKTLELDPQTHLIGVPALILTTLIFTISGISRRFHIWEGGFYLLLYVLFIANLFGWM